MSAGTGDAAPRLVMPADEYAIVTGAWRDWMASPLKAALEQAIADAVAAERERAEAAEAKLDEVRSVLLEGGQEDATARRRALAITGTGEEPKP